MKKFLIISMTSLCLLLPVHTVFAIEYCADFLEYGNPGGWENSLKTCDQYIHCTAGYSYLIDLWLTAVPEPLASAGFYLEYNPDAVSILGVKGYDGSDLSGPWQPPIIAGPDGPGTYFVITYTLDVGGAQPDAEGDIIIAQIELRCNAFGDDEITISTIPTLSTVIGKSGYTYDYWLSPATIPVRSSSYDYDGDGLDDWLDNCPYDYFNDIDVDSVCGDIDNCSADYNPDQEDIYPPQGNDIGDACECEGNFDCNTTVDGLDAATFKADYGRSSINRPCTNGDPCNGDFACNGNVDGLDAALFKQDFGRSAINNPCPPCEVGVWCIY